MFGAGPVHERGGLDLGGTGKTGFGAHGLIPQYAYDSCWRLSAEDFNIFFVRNHCLDCVDSSYF